MGEGRWSHHRRASDKYRKSAVNRPEEDLSHLINRKSKGNGKKGKR